MSLDIQASDEIFLLAQSCRGPFTEILAQLRHAHGAERLVQEHQQRYEAWIAFLGVLAEGKLGLDHRLRNSPEIKSLVIQQLQVLNRNLKAERELTERLKQGEHPNDDGHQLSPILKATFSGVEAALDRLHRLGVAIRDASAGQLMRRIQPLTNDKRVSSFEIMAYSIASTLYPCANPQLLEHVSAALARNYQIILYRQGRDRQYRVPPVLAQQQNRDQQPPHSKLVGREVPPTEPKSLPRSEPYTQEPKQERAQSSIISSTFDQREFNKHYSRVEATPETPLPPTTSIRVGSINYPPPQDIPDTAKYAICQWCFESHPASMFKTPSEWRRHVQKDWKPYICVSEQCAKLTPVPSFAESSRWESHMQARHGKDWSRMVYKPPTWICDLEHLGMDEAQTPRFTTDEKLASHVRESHEEITSDEIQAMIRHNTVLLNRAADVCPFCCYIVEGDGAKSKNRNAAVTTSGVKTTGPNTSISKTLYDISEESEGGSSEPLFRQMDRHVARHLNNLTMTIIRMLSIPDSSGDSENEESITFPETDTIGDDDSRYQDWESSGEEAEDEQPKPHTQHPRSLVPFARNPNFVGREPILQQLLDRIPPSTNKDACQRTAVEGLGGIGKTQVALEAAYRVHEQLPTCSIFWVPAINAVSFEIAYRKIGEVLGVQGLDDDKADVKSLVKVALSRESAGDWLFIVDNADDLKLFADSTLADHLPSSRNGSILFTTRNHQVAIELGIGDHAITLQEMSKTEAIELLQTDLKRSQMSNTEDVTQLSEFLANLPLAIKQAAAYIATKGISITEYLGYCKSGDKTMMALLSFHFMDHGRYLNITNQIAKTWSISFDHISQNRPLAIQYLEYMSFLAEEDIPISLLPSGEDELEKDEAIATLQGYAFIRRRDNPDSFDIHRLVRMTMRDWIEEHQKLETCLTYTIQQLSRIFPFPEDENREIWMRYLPHGQAVLEFWEYCVDKEASANLFNKVGESCLMLGKYYEAQTMHSQALALREKILGREHLSTLTSMSNLARVFRIWRRYNEAEELYSTVLQFSEKVLGSDHPSTLATISDLAGVLSYQRKYKKAELLYRKALELSQAVLGSDHPSTLTNMSNLAGVLSNQGKYKEAELLYRKALELSQAVLGFDHPSTLTNMSNLAVVLDIQRNYKEAETMNRQALELREVVLGHEHPSTLTSMSNLARVLHILKEYNKAEELYSTVLQISEKVLGSEHPSTLATMSKLAGVLNDQGRYGEAEAMNRQALAKGGGAGPRAPLNAHQYE